MAMPARLSRTLRQRLGDEATQDLVDWMGQMESGRSELREMMDGYMNRIDARFERIDARFERIEARFVEHDLKMEAMEARLEASFERRFGDLMKWSFVFWCGAVGAVAMLARALG